MNDLSNAAVSEHQTSFSCKPLPSLALLTLLTLSLIGLSVSIFILVVVHNAAFLLSFLLLFALVASFLAWNAVNWRHHNRSAFAFFINSLPDSDLRLAREGQLVKITGRFSTDFYVTDRKSGIRALVKAGSGCKVIPLIIESKLVTTTNQCRALSPHLGNWLRERNLSGDSRLLRLEEGYVQEGNTVTVTGMLRKIDDVLMIVQLPELVSTGCLWRRLLLPVDVDGLILAPGGS
ncbi:Ubiquitin-specific protease family C19-related protein isoform 2 [Hibiscus syriacus]|uniref:Ubiquitin-specific protease family C19-related protein isoform 2 n=1 Tax=Hibiscus syriacus TaxID=106335 RepID=A0A6A3C5H9_HIBSY|nr:Ubiquitin-specific protease family C19-related protein isoform 2 [Hibiscus syriacus]